MSTTAKVLEKWAFSADSRIQSTVHHDKDTLTLLTNNIDQHKAHIG